MPQILIYILVMAVITYLIRVLPFILLKKEITNRTVKSFLYYVPYVTLATMTFPAILSATGHAVSSYAGFAAALLLAVKNKSLLTVAGGASLTALLVELIYMVVK